MAKKYCTDRSYGDWNIHVNDDGSASIDRIAVLMLSDIRRELRTLNAVLACPNFQAIPRKLDRISKNTAKPRKRRSKANRGAKP